MREHRAMTATARRQSRLTKSQRKVSLDRSFVSFGGGSSRQEPPPADYTDEVSDEHLRALRECVVEEFEGETFEIASGPAW
jgi:hypothetical protein